MIGKKRILITGSDGQLGKKIKFFKKNHKQYEFIFKGKKDLDITNYNLLQQYFHNTKIDYLINCAAFTNVDACEKNRIHANLVNNIAVGHLADLCKKFKIKFIHISTDYVFDGKKKGEYSEDDKTNPVNFYGQTKLEGEKNFLNKKLRDSIIIRTSWLYSDEKNNFLTNFLKRVKDKSRI